MMSPLSPGSLESSRSWRSLPLWSRQTAPPKSRLPSLCATNNWQRKSPFARIQRSVPFDMLYQTLMSKKTLLLALLVLSLSLLLVAQQSMERIDLNIVHKIKTAELGGGGGG